MMKKQYENPSIKIAVINFCDVVCASSDGNEGNNTNLDLNYGDHTWSGEDVD